MANGNNANINGGSGASGGVGVKENAKLKWGNTDKASYILKLYQCDINFLIMNTI